MKRRPIIGITTYQPIPEKSVGFNTASLYIEVVYRCGAVPIMLPHIACDCIDDWLSITDGIIMTGGGDVDPALYHHAQITAPVSGVNQRRDEVELALIHRIMEENKPCVAICRGMQLLNVALGGSLYVDIRQEVPKSTVAHWNPDANCHTLHRVKISEDSKLYGIMGDNPMIVSYHHQAVKTVGKGLRATAWAPDGIIEATESDEFDCLIGTQWHPERSALVDPTQLNLFRHLVNVCTEKL